MTSPLIFELNVRCWLSALSRRHGKLITLKNIPSAEFDSWRARGFTDVWLMGVFPTGPQSRQHALEHRESILKDNGAIGTWSDDEVTGSPYAIADFSIDPEIGGETGLHHFRNQLHEVGMRLILDAVCNHVGLDHRWLREQPDVFVQSEEPMPETWRPGKGARWLAYGKDPHFPAWADTIQLDYRKPQTRSAMIDVLKSIAALCDGVRCDMAMLLLNDIFAKTWNDFPVGNAPPREEFWSEAIRAVRETRPGFLFFAEVYWDCEPRLQELGFDYTYDKILYDLLLQREPVAVQRHLIRASPSYLSRSLHFLENHDEPRAAQLFSEQEHKAAALVVLGSPGARLVHGGQLEGWRIKTPVQFGRYAEEVGEPSLQAFYQKLLRALASSEVGSGTGTVLQPRCAWPENASAECFIAVQWHSGKPAWDLVVVNLGAHRGQCYVTLTFPGLRNHNWEMVDRLGTENYQRFGEDLETNGLYLDVPAHGAQLFHFQPLR